VTDVVSFYLPGHVDPYDSYGLIACELARHFTRAGMHVNLLPLGHRHMESQDAELQAITQQPVRTALGGLLFGYPTSFAVHPPVAQEGPRIAITMFESSKLPPSWQGPLNRCDAVVIPSRFCHQTFAAAGVTAPLYVVPLGVSELYQPVERQNGPVLTFLAFLDRGSRKGGLAAVQAFLQAFGDNPEYRLILKSRKPKVKMNLLNDNIDIIQADMTESELYHLYLSTDCLINPNRGEGFGLIPRAYAATGGIALATDWGGTADEIDAWGVPLPYTLVPAAWEGVKKFEGLDLGVWAEPDLEGIAQILRQVAAQRLWYRQRAMAAARWVQAHYRWSDFAESVLEIWQGVTSPALPKEKLEWLPM
jgi:glycosyltransferase involved in cell wall biosynthesis